MFRQIRLLGRSITLSRIPESKILVINDKYCIVPPVLRNQFCTEITATLKGKVSLPLLLPQGFVLQTVTLKAFTDLKGTPLIFLHF